jgi:asparagine synthetase B (glutamine-hydrolysing)
MSAIAGLYNLNNEEPVSIEQRNGMMQALEKFPSDDIQVWQKGPVFLGCHAQWITPESIGEQLPFYDSERKCAITADCIIDNREDLFEALQVPKEDQKTIPDSLLILLSYYKWGEDCPKHLIGDFAFMIWDERERKMFGARDASGYRTLYYFKSNTRFVFCTTIEPMLSLPYINKQLNEEYIAEFLAITGLIDTAGAHITPYSNIYQVPPFNTITITKESFKLSRYGYFYPENPIKLKNNNEYIEAFQEIFKEAINCRLRTHRKIGSQLSGGLDSGAVVSFATKKLKKEHKILHTFSYYPPSDFKDFTRTDIVADERPYIKKTVEYVGGISDHYYDFKGISSYSVIDDILEANEMPYKFLENSFWLKGMFEKASEQGIGILLNGDKGNFTISWGSALDYYAVLFKKFQWLRLYQELNKFSRNIGGARYRLLPTIAKISFPFFDNLFNKDNVHTPSKLINPSFAERTGVFKKLKKYGIDETGWIASPDLFDLRRATFEDIYAWNAGNTLDCKLSLRYSLWKRDPTNDLRVVRFCLSVPEKYYVQNGMDRALIRKSTENYLPDDVRLNQRVRGIQGIDWLHRMIPNWNLFIKEIDELSMEKKVLEFINSQTIESALTKAQKKVRPELIIDSDYRTLMQFLIIYRYIKKFT